MTTHFYERFQTPIVIPAAFSPRESGEGIQCRWLQFSIADERRWVPAPD